MSQSKSVQRGYSRKWLSRVHLPNGSVLAQSGRCVGSSLTVSVGGCDVTTPVSISATFASNCDDCEYRQYVKGTLEYRSTPGTGSWTSSPSQIYGGGYLSPSSMQEDGCDSGAHRYGHRGETQCDSGAFSSCGYSATDHPGFSTFPSGYEYRYQMDFESDTVDGYGNVVDSKLWSVSCQGVKP